MSFLSPVALGLSGLAVPLLALYFLRLRRRRVKVPSLLPWHALQRSERLASPFQRFRRNLLLWVQLLLLALLVLAAARPFLETDAAHSRSLVLVLDTSASMGATDGSPTRMADAVREASSLVDTLGPTDEVMIVTAGPRTEVVTPFTRDHGAASRALAALTPTEAAGDLEEALRLSLSVARSRPEVEVVVLSDGGPRELSSVPAGGAKVGFVRVGRGDDNAGIVALDLGRSPVSELDRQLFVTARWFGREATDAAVEVYLDEALIGLRTVRLDPETPVSLVFDLQSDAEGTLRVRLDADGDLLPADDVAWAVLSPLGARDVLLVGGDALLARILASDPRIHARRVAPSDLTPALLDEADCVFFAAAVPDGMEGRAYAVLGPVANAPVTFGDEVRTPRVLGWQRTHPALRFTRWDDVTIAAARRVVDAGGLQPLVDGDSGPLVLAGERRGGRVLQLAFDPLKTDLPLRVAWPVLILNAVGWLTEGAGVDEGVQVQAGRPFVLRLDDGAAPEARVKGPAGAVDVSVGDGALLVADTARVGVYDVRFGARQVRFAANLLSEEESRLRPRAELGLSGDPVAAGVGSALAAGRREIWRPLLVGALALLLLEWLLWNRRRAA